MPHNKYSLTREPDRIRLRAAMRETTPSALAIWMLLHERDLTSPTSSPALARAWGMKASTVQTALALLTRIGFISSEARGRKTLVSLKVRLDVSTGAYIRHGVSL